MQLGGRLVCVAVCVVVLGALATATAPGLLTRVRVRSVGPQRVADPVQLDVFPPTFNATLSWVTVRWTGISNPAAGDWVGLYEAGDLLNETAPIKYQFANASASYLSTGAGSLRVQIVNARSDHVFVFFRNGLDNPVVAARSPVVATTSPNYPSQPRLALAAGGAVRVTWTSRDRVSPVVRWHAGSGAVQSIAAATTTYTRTQMCGAPATTAGFRDPGLFHSAVLPPLPPGQPVTYQFGDEALGLSGWYAFSAPPAPASAVQFVAYGDLGQYQLDDTLQEDDMAPSLNTTTAILSEIDETQLVHHIGDISYARGYTSQWEQFHAQIADIASRVPYMVGIGNHERDWPDSGSTVGTTDSGGECGVAYEARFPMPTAAADQPWYAYTFGPVAFVVMSTEQAWDAASPQYAFLQQALAAVDRTATPWLVFSGHRPLYVDSKAKSDDETVAAALRASLEDLLYKYKVDIIFGAHHHSYQRTCPVYQNACQQPGPDGYAGPVVVDLGMAGASNSKLSKHPSPIFLVANDDTHGFTRVRATPSSFTLQYIEGLEKNVMDEFTLTK